MCANDLSVHAAAAEKTGTDARDAGVASVYLKWAVNKTINKQDQE